ncbi:MAG TPA: ABC transporter permease subunit [Candidatus Caccousia avicola]|uniref:ABC transporter permease subunit n=1 Tax=Candidatus Caccousia avicola TaxID=2840721 RepID=A0A9D1AL62_9FIRM|nr:ABC transporter permease subunit [Candidatus Caccousia avicola]
MKNKPKLRRFLFSALAVLFWLAVWEIASLLVHLELLLPSPVRVAERLLALAGETEFWAAAGGSMLRVLCGFFLALLTGLCGAALAFRFPAVEALLRPLLSIIKAAPVASFILLALVWIASPGVPVFTSFLMVFPIVFENVLGGIRSADRNLVEMGRMFHFSPFAMFRHIYLPSAAPYLSAACTSGLGLAWKAGVAAEVLANTRLSLGGQIYASKIYLETPDLFAWTAVVIAMSVALEKLVLLLMRRLLALLHLEAAHADHSTLDKKL